MSSSSRRHQDWPVESKVYVGGLRSDCTKTDIEDAFEKYGRILNVWIAQRPPGFGFVLFEDAMDAKDAARGLDGGKVAGHRVQVEMARDYAGGGGGGDRDRDRGRRSPPPRRRSRSPPPRRRSRSRSPAPKRRRSRTPERKRRDRSDERRRR